jgi:hypothetical protein
MLQRHHILSSAATENGAPKWEHVDAQVWDMGLQLADLRSAADERAVRGKPLPQKPRHAHCHAAEGFALDWSRVEAGRLASGDCRRGIHVWDPNQKGNWSVSGAYQVPSPLSPIGSTMLTLFVLKL